MMRDEWHYCYEDSLKGIIMNCEQCGTEETSPEAYCTACAEEGRLLCVQCCICEPMERIDQIIARIKWKREEDVEVL